MAMQAVDDNEDDDEGPYASVATDGPKARDWADQSQRGPSRRLTMRDARIAKRIAK